MDTSQVEKNIVWFGEPCALTSWCLGYVGLRGGIVGADVEGKYKRW
jgi:hypothetical protein